MFHLAPGYVAYAIDRIRGWLVVAAVCGAGVGMVVFGGWLWWSELHAVQTVGKTSVKAVADAHEEVQVSWGCTLAWGNVNNPCGGEEGRASVIAVDPRNPSVWHGQCCGFLDDEAKCGATGCGSNEFDGWEEKANP